MRILFWFFKRKIIIKFFCLLRQINFYLSELNKCMRSSADEIFSLNLIKKDRDRMSKSVFKFGIFLFDLFETELISKWLL